MLLSAWNGSIETHQSTDRGKIVDEIADLREFDPAEHVADVITSDGENMIYMRPGDYLNYTPSTSSNAMEIPFVARIICVADAFDAMNTNRVYRDKLTKEDIIAEIERCKETQFDPTVADVMINLLKNDKLNIGWRENEG